MKTTFKHITTYKEYSIYFYECESYKMYVIYDKWDNEIEEGFNNLKETKDYIKNLKKEEN